MLDIRLAPLRIFGAPYRGERSGLFLKPDGLQGWEGLPASRREALARAVQHGEHDVPTYLPARVVTLDGWVLATSEDDLRRQMQQIRALGGPGGRVGMAVDQLGQTLSATGRRILAEARDTASRHHRGEFQIQLVFADPRQYAEPVRLPETVNDTSFDVSHGGTFPALPVFEIPGGLASYSISSPAGTFTVNGATVGGLHRVDMRTGRVTRDGVHMPGVGRGPLWAIPSDAVWRHTMTLPGRVRISDTYI